MSKLAAGRAKARFAVPTNAIKSVDHNARLDAFLLVSTSTAIPEVQHFERRSVPHTPLQR